MIKNKNRIQAVPTNIITGFLGVGKTSAILHLLEQKPSSEKWAVLVNEFGEIGVDGSLLNGSKNAEQGIYIREVPGGCMCCTAGIPMQFALNQLLRLSKPDRLLIEPSGLGHPKEVVETLKLQQNINVLSLQKIVTLLDARNLHDSRYTDHSTFTQQIDIADVIVANKKELYDANDISKLHDYLELRGKTNSHLIMTNFGRFEMSLLDGDSKVAQSSDKKSHDLLKSHSPKTDTLQTASEKNSSLTIDQTKTESISDSNFETDSIPLPGCGYLRVENHQASHNSVGWRFSAQKIFKRYALLTWLTGLQVDRLKGVFITDDGIYGYNRSSDVLTEMALDDCIESRFEMINDSSKAMPNENPLDCLLENI